MASAEFANNAPGATARRRAFWTRSDLIAGAFLIAVAALVVIPLANLVRIALSGESDIWADLAAYVIPEALRVTVLLLAGIAALTALIGVGTAWLVTAYRFPGRDILSWALALPARLPDLHRGLCLRRHLRCVRPGAEPPARAHRLAARRNLLVSEHPLVARRDLRLLARALSVCVPCGARDVPDPERMPVRGARARSARRVSCWRAMWRLPLARAGARGRSSRLP
jgi:hypothetical protein